MLLLFLLTLYVYDVNSEVCAEFSFGSSHYKVTFVEVTSPADYRKWNEIREMCNEDYELVSITSADENNKIFDMLDDCTDGGYAIGLSRDAGVDKLIDSNWNWESGETAAGLFWAVGEPNAQTDECGFAFMFKTDGVPDNWRDDKCTDYFGTWPGSQGYGYICEKPITTTIVQSSTTAVNIETSRRTTGADLHSVSIPTFTDVKQEQNTCSCEIENSTGSSAPTYNLIVVVVILSVIILALIPALIFYSRFYYNHKEKRTDAVVYDNVSKNLADESYQVPIAITTHTYAQPVLSNKEFDKQFDENMDAYMSVADPVYINSRK